LGRLKKKRLRVDYFRKDGVCKKNKSQFGDIKEVGEIKNPYFCNNFE
jgi:hypothetical protein